MELLLDTSTLLLALFDDDKLPKNVKELIEDAENDIYVSAVSLWEIAIKHNSHPDLMPYNLKKIYDVIDELTDFHIISIDPEYILAYEIIAKQKINRDPFDQLLVSTAKTRNMSLVTNDKNILRYKGIRFISY